jgi:predicted transposase YbfD/YdcC
MGRHSRHVEIHPMKRKSCSPESRSVLATQALELDDCVSQAFSLTLCSAGFEPDTALPVDFPFVGVDQSPRFARRPAGAQPVLLSKTIHMDRDPVAQKKVEFVLSESGKGSKESDSRTISRFTSLDRGAIIKPGGVSPRILRQAVINYIDEQSENDFASVNARQHQTEETGHGRKETRNYIQMPMPKTLPGLELWKGLKSIGMVVSECIRNGKETVEVRYYISRLAVSVKRFAHAVRGHWGIENTCHWSLGVTYREDESPIRDKHMREKFAWINRLTLSLLKQHPGRESLAMQRRSRVWSDEFLLEVLSGATL